MITDTDKKNIQSEAEKKEVDAQSKADIERQNVRKDLRELYSNANAFSEKQFYEDAIKQMEQICEILEQKQITDLEEEQRLIANWKKMSEKKVAKKKAELKSKQDALISEAQHFYYNGDLENAKSKAQEALAIYEDDSIRMLLGKIEKEIEIKKQNEEIERSSNARFNETLKTVLHDKATSLGNIIGTTKKWLSFDGHTFTDEEYEVLKECIGQQPDKEKMSLKKKQKELVKAIGKDYAEKLLKDFGFINKD